MCVKLAECDHMNAMTFVKIQWMCIICLSIRIDFIINLHRTENKMLKLIFRAKHIAQFNVSEFYREKILYRFFIE